MRAIRICFLHMLQVVRRDMMLVMVCTAPLLIGLALRFLLPALENILTGYFDRTSILAPYYSLFDLFFAVITPVMFCFAAAMVILEEIDDHLACYLSVTPLKKSGYLLARLGIPALCAYGAAVVLLPVFGLTELSLADVLLMAASGTAQGLMSTMMIVGFSSNKLEGMAVTKISSLVLLGALVPYFVPGSIGYLASPLPSFWMAKAVREGRPLCYLLSILLAVLWCIFLGRQFARKVAR